MNRQQFGSSILNWTYKSSLFVFFFKKISKTPQHLNSLKWHGTWKMQFLRIGYVRMRVHVTCGGWV